MKRFDYRHILCIFLTLVFIGGGFFLFRESVGRLIEGGRDFGLSAAFLFCTIFRIDHSFAATVNSAPKKSFFSFLPEKTRLIDLSSFRDGFGAFWKAFVRRETFFGYLYSLLRSVPVVFVFLLFICVAAFVLFFLFRRYTKTSCDDPERISLPLRIHIAFLRRIYVPVKTWLFSFGAFVRERRAYWIIWLCVAALYSNVVSIAFELLAYLLYLCASFDFSTIFFQLYKLYLDLAIFFKAIPGPIWVIFGFWLLHRIAYNVGYDRLDHRERKNRGFLNSLGVINEVYGYVGAGKTMLATDIALSYEAQFLSDALEIILETDCRFPAFPWSQLEKELKDAIASHVVFDVWSVREWVKRKQSDFEADPSIDKIFGYRADVFDYDYDDKLCLMDVWAAIENYACAYLIYTVQSSYIISNYAIRSDVLRDSGWFPLYNADFFRRDSRFIDAFSRHSHILDFDMMRLGKIMLKENPNRFAFGFGIYVVSEIDKERKNSPELQDVKKDSEECNQKNDLQNALWKMCRHACIVANRVFVRILGDLQRVGSLSSDTVELGDLVNVTAKEEKICLLPAFAPFWFIDGLLFPLAEKIDRFYLKYKNVRADRTLFVHFLHGISARIHRYHDRAYNLFGSQIVRLELENGKRDGKVREAVWYSQSKKILSGRYASDCMSAIFSSRAKKNSVGLDDLQTYETIMASNEERELQHSHFQKEISTFIGNKGTSEDPVDIEALKRRLRR